VTRVLPLTVQHQLQTNWCWAACSVSTSDFFDPPTSWEQCEVAGKELERGDCCGGGAGGACNVPWYLDRALRRTGNFDSKSSGTASWKTLTREIDAGRPVGARIGWKGGGGHFVLLTGYRSAGGRREVVVEDPWTGRSSVPVDVFATRYKSTGTWTHTYLTER
jgi:hypothetical protein